MISIKRIDSPAELTANVVSDLTAEFIANGTRVWAKSYIKRDLLTMSNNKCAYCEAKVDEESKYMEVEHFHDKDTYPNEVVRWDNLLPSCKKCNGQKGTHDTYIEPIIDPTNTDPKEHIEFWRYRLRSNTDLGKMTISVLELNNQDRHTKVRFRLGEEINRQLDSILALLVDYENGSNTTVIRRNRIIRKTKNLLRQGRRIEEYSSIVSTLIMNDSDLDHVFAKLKELNFWDEELDSLNAEISTNSLNIYQRN